MLEERFERYEAIVGKNAGPAIRDGKPKATRARRRCRRRREKKLAAANAPQGGGFPVVANAGACRHGQRGD
jgi:hypothetical protein